MLVGITQTRTQQMSLFSKNLSKTCIRCRVDKVVTSFKVSLDLIFGRTHNEKKRFQCIGCTSAYFFNQHCIYKVRESPFLET